MPSCRRLPLSVVLVAVAIALCAAFSTRALAADEPPPAGALPQIPPQVNQAALDQLGWKIGCQAYTFREMPLLDALETMKRLGIHYVELFPGQHFSKEHPERTGPDLSPERIAELKAKLAACDITAVSFGVTQISNDEADARKTFEFARTMGLTQIVAEPPEEALPMVDKLANEYGISVAIHNHPKSSRSHYWDCQTVLDAIKDRSKRIGSCSDVGHWIRSGLSSAECIKKLDGRIIELHWKDIRPAGEGKWQDVPWTTGVVDQPAILRELKRQGFKGIFFTEYESTTGEELVQNVARSIANFSALVTKLAAGEGDANAAAAAADNQQGQAALNTLTDAEKQAGWRMLFDGKTTNGWRGYRRQDVPAGWQAVDGALTRIKGSAGDLITTDQFENFELMLDWKLAKGGNSGIIYRCDESADTCWLTGPEMQILDNAAHHFPWNHPQACGACYELYPCTVDANKPIGQWNTYRIVCDGDHVEQWFNGKKVVEYQRGSDDWNQRVAKSKFKVNPKFGTLTKGYIALQDHGAQVQFRNIKIRPLPAPAAAAGRQ